MVLKDSSDESPIRLTAIITVAETLRHVPGLAQHINDKSLSLVICSGLREIVGTCRQHAPCILVADISLLADTDLAEFARAADLDPSIKVLIVVDEDDPQFCQKLLRMGFAGAIRRSAPAVFFRRAIEAVGQGELWASRIAISAVVREFLSEASPLGLSRREGEILHLVAKGFKNQKIADSLFVTRETVRWHLRSIYSKLGVPGRKNAIEYALAKGMAKARRTDGREGAKDPHQRACS